MEEKLVTLETAKLAKEKSFNWSTYMIWMFEYPYYMSEKKTGITEKGIIIVIYRFMSLGVTHRHKVILPNG